MDETEELLKRLNNSRDLESLSTYLDNIEKVIPISISDYLKAILKEKNMTPSDVIKKSRIERTYCYQILNGRKKPGRDKLIAIALALSLDLNETQRLLETAKEGVLYAKSKRDSVLIYALNNKMSVLDTNYLLNQYEEIELR